MKHRITRGIAAAVGLSVAVVLAGCSTPSADPVESDEPAEIVEADIVVATGPTLSNTNVYIAQSQGIFEDHGLTAENAVITAGPDAIPQLLSGDWTFAMVDTATAITAAKEGVPVTAVATSTVGVSARDGYAAIMTTPGSGIEDVTDLAGRKMQINALGGTAEALVRATMEAAGGDPDEIQFVEIPPQGALPAIQAGQVDAGFIPEPLLTAALGQGLIDIANPEQETIPGIPSFVFLASAQFAAENPQVVAQFQDAILEANALANSDHDLVLETAKTSTTVDPGLLSQVKRFPQYGEEQLSTDQVQAFIDFMVKYGVIAEGDAPEASAVVFAG